MDRIIEIKHGTATVYRYSYDGEGNLVAVENCLLGVVTSYFYNIDGTLMRAASTDGTEYYYEYVDDMLSKVYQIANGVTWVTEYSYDDNGEPEQITLNSGVTVSDTQDVFGRKTGRQYKDAQNNSILDVALTYLDGANGSKSEYLGSYRNGTDPAYVYTYDGNGNITSVTHGSDVVTYTYDELNQLVRVNDSAANTTTVYTYDLGGNILSKSEYNYTTGTLPNLARETYTYSYDSDWKDLLVNYNGTPITYDDNGNPLSYRGYDMVWNGRQLRSMSGDEQNLLFAYNENGLRVEKTVNHTPSGSSAYTTRTAYAYSGTQLMAETRYDNSGAEEAVLHYSYDTAGSLVSVNYNGTEYYYLRNGQNDVVGLIDGNGNTVVEYTYDAWGKLLTTTGTYASTLGVDNPIRYRGYYYDEETGLYYLQSRYYDPETCRFINADDVLILAIEQGNIVECNLFTYCFNNPANNNDPSGYVTPANVIGAIIGGIMGAIGGYFLANYLANLIKFKNDFWKKVFIGGLTALITAAAAVIGYFIGPYVAKMWTYISAKLVALVKGAYKGIRFAASHMMDTKHAWNLVLGNNATESSVKNLVLKAVIHGKWDFLGDGSISILFKYGGQTINVTGKIVNYIFIISNAWVVTK